MTNMVASLGKCIFCKKKCSNNLNGCPLHSWLRMQMTNKELAKEVDEAQLKTYVSIMVYSRNSPVTKNFVWHLSD